MPRLKTMPPRIDRLDHRLRQPKMAAGFYASREWQAARQLAIGLAAYRCSKCGARGVRLFVDHIVELADGGAEFDQGNLQVLCGSCHTLKTHAERERRAR